ncbi:hypothetical protein B7P43_G13137, partial [Cryptotermes secundus]
MENISQTTKQGETVYMWEVERSETSNENIMHNRDQEVIEKSVGVEDLQKVSGSEIQVKNGTGNIQTANFSINAQSQAQDLHEDLSTTFTAMFKSRQYPTSKIQEATAPTAERGMKPEDILAESYHMNTHNKSKNTIELSVRARLENELQQEFKDDFMSSSTGLNNIEGLSVKNDFVTSTSQMESKNSLAINSKHKKSKTSSETATGP